MNKTRAKTIVASALTFAAMACTCGPLGQITELQGTFESAQSEFEEVGTLAADGLAEAEQAAEEAAQEALEEAPAVVEEAQELVPEGLEPAAPSGDEIEQWAAAVVSVSSQYGEDSWSALQVLGEPNTFECGDITTAWASDFPDGSERLAFSYVESVFPTRISIYETYNPGAIVRVSVVTPNGTEFPVFSSTPEVVTSCPRVLTIDVTNVNEAVNQVIIELDETNHPSWNEIDAVRLDGVPNQ